MPHTVKDKDKLILRVRRIRGQLDAVERALADERDCSDIMQLLSACRGALGGLTAEVIEGHVQMHIAEPDTRATRTRAGQELIEVLKTYLR